MSEEDFMDWSFVVDFMVATLVYLSLSGMAPTRLSVGLRWRLPSAAFCQIKDVLSDGPTATDLQQADINFQRFKVLLKTFLFVCWDRGTLWLTVKAVPHKVSYLLTYLRSLTHSLVDHRRWRLATADDHSIVFILHCSLSCYISFSWM